MENSLESVFSDPMTDRLLDRLSGINPRFCLFKMARTTFMETAPEQHDFLELLFVLHGSPRFRIGSALYHLSPGQLLIIGAGQAHQMIFAGENSSYERIVAYISRKYISQLSLTVNQGTFRQALTEDIHKGAWVMTFPPEIRAFVASTLTMLYRDQMNPDQFSDGLADDLWQAFFSILIRAEQGLVSYAETQEETALSPLTVSLLQYIEEHYAEEFSLDQLANRFYTSKNNLMSTFRRDIGTSIYNYLLRRRIAEARHMLLQGRAPTEAAAKCGFRDYSNFYRAFLSVCGCGPREYLRSERNAKTKLSGQQESDANSGL